MECRILGGAESKVAEHVTCQGKECSARSATATATADLFVFKYRELVLEYGISTFLDTGIALR